MDSIIAYLMAATLSMLSLGGFIVWGQQATNSIQNAAIAGQMRLLERAGEQYIQDNSAALAASATPTVPVTVTVAQLVAGGYVPAGTMATNALQQAWQIQVLQPTPGSLQALLESIGGRAMSDPKRLVTIAAQAGAEGGYVPYNNQMGTGVAQTNAYGSYGTWQTPLTGFTNPGPGHWASLLAFSNANTNNNYLYRVAVPGQPSLNSMQTDLGMTDLGGTPHNVNGANSYNVTGGGTLDSDQGGSIELGGNNTTAGSGTPYVDFHLGGQGVQDFNARIINQTDGNLEIEGAHGNGSLTTQGDVNAGGMVHAMGTTVANCPTGWGCGMTTWDLYANGSVGVGPPGGPVNAQMNSSGTISTVSTITPGSVATAGAGCGQSGAIGADAGGSGRILACVGGTWTPLGTPVGALGQPCSLSGQIGQTSTGYGLVCTNGVWASADNRMGALSLVATYYVMGDGSFVSAPSCSGSTFPPRIVVTPAAWKATSALSWQFSASAAGGGWIVNMKDGSGNPLPNSWAVASVYCRWY